MFIKLFGFIFGKVIGFDYIPEDRRDKFIKEIAVPLMKEAVKSAVQSGGEEVMVNFHKRF